MSTNSGSFMAESFGAEGSVSPAPVLSLEAVTLTLPSAAGPVNILRGVDLSVGRASGWR
jgi:hypothetical protein